MHDRKKPRFLAERSCLGQPIQVLVCKDRRKITMQKYRQYGEQPIHHSVLFLKICQNLGF